MIVYKDHAWCTSSTLCANTKCFRNYSPEERVQNLETVKLPISQAEFKSEDCGFRPKTAVSST